MEEAKVRDDCVQKHLRGAQVYDDVADMHPFAEQLLRLSRRRVWRAFDRP